MAMEEGQLKNIGQLLLAALTGAILIAAALFAGWFISFIIMGVIGKSLLVGMYYLAWPIVFPLISMPVIFILMLVIMPIFKKPFPEILACHGFLFGVLVPMFVIAMALMLATCPLENGGTLLTTGWDGFGSQ